MRIRETEQLNVPIWREIENRMKVIDLQGVLFSGDKTDIENALKRKKYDMELTCVEAVQLDDTEEFLDAFKKSFTPEQWMYKLEFSKTIDAQLYLIVYQQGTIKQNLRFR